jgi:hypothetical protein
MPLPTTFPTSLPRFNAGAILDQIQMPHHWPAQGDLLSFCYKMGPGEAALFVILGVILLLFGINIFKFVVMLNAALLGAAIGAFIGEKAGNTAVGATVGGFTGAVLSWPLLKHAVALMGGVIGAVVGASVWRLLNLNPEFFWAGALCGGVTFGLLSFLLFRGCVMIYTALQGSSMVVVGILALVFKYQDLAPRLTQALSAKAYILPIAIFIPAMCGLIFQQTPITAGAATPQKK